MCQRYNYMCQMILLFWPSWLHQSKMAMWERGDHINWLTVTLPPTGPGGPGGPTSPSSPLTPTKPLVPWKRTNSNGY